MNVLVILAVFYLAVLLLKQLTLESTRAKALHPLVINVVIVGGLVLATAACFGVTVIPALSR